MNKKVGRTPWSAADALVGPLAKKPAGGPAADQGVRPTFWGIIAGILRELSDETSYARHLKAHGVAHSPEEWRKFTEERWNAAAKRPRCC